MVAGYTSCCEEGLCRGKDIASRGPASCTCDLLCGEIGTCCSDVVITCPDGELVREREKWKKESRRRQRGNDTRQADDTDEYRIKVCIPSNLESFATAPRT